MVAARLLSLLTTSGCLAVAAWASQASDGERTFVFISREYVKEFAPTTLKGLSKLDMQEKIKEKQDAAKQVATKPTHAHSATPIISN